MDDLTHVLSSIPKLILDHWMFLVVSFILGMVGQVFKTRVWTKERAEKSYVHYWVRAFLPLHAPLVGMLLGIVIVMIFGDHAPAGPGVVGAGQIVIYYTGAGGLSAWVVSLWKHLMQSRGIADPHRPSVVPGPSLDEEGEGLSSDSIPPPLPLSKRTVRGDRVS